MSLFVSYFFDMAWSFDLMCYPYLTLLFSSLLCELAILILMESWFFSEWIQLAKNLILYSSLMIYVTPMGYVTLVTMPFSNTQFILLKPPHSYTTLL